MKYRSPEPRDRTELEAALSARDTATVSTALVDLAHHGEPSWANEVVLEMAHSREVEVQRAAILGFGILSRRGALRSHRSVWQLLLDLAASASPVAGVAEDMLDDLETYGVVGSAQFARETQEHLES